MTFNNDIRTNPGRARKGAPLYGRRRSNSQGSSTLDNMTKQRQANAQSSSQNFLKGVNRENGVPAGIARKKNYVNRKFDAIARRAGKRGTNG